MWESFRGSAFDGMRSIVRGLHIGFSPVYHHIDGAFFSRGAMGMVRRHAIRITEKGHVWPNRVDTSSLSFTGCFRMTQIPAGNQTLGPDA